MEMDNTRTQRSAAISDKIPTRVIRHTYRFVSETKLNNVFLASKAYRCQPLFVTELIYSFILAMIVPRSLGF